MLYGARRGAAIAVPRSDNSKTGPIANTYVPIANTCPRTCPFLDRGCYAQSGPMALHNARLEARARGASALEVAQAEAVGVDALPADRPLRLHVVGDARTDAAARVLSDATARYIIRGGQPVFTYTHAWRTVARESWGPVSVLASCENVPAAKQASERGYAAAVVVKAHPVDGRAYEQDGMKVIPCPEQTRGISCSSCRLCFDANKLRDRSAVIAFAPHGSKAKRVQEIVG